MTERWLSGRPPQQRTTALAPPRKVGKQVAGRGRDFNEGLRLVVPLGPYPAATLVSLYTHAPETAYVIYDAGTEAVRAAAAQLAAAATALPVKQLHFVASDISGANLAAWLLRHESSLKGARVDITPGTKAQSTALAAIGDDAQPWGIDRQRWQVRPLRGDDTAALPLLGPDVRTVLDVDGASDYHLVEHPSHALLLIQQLYAALCELDPPKRLALGELRSRDCGPRRMRVHRRVVEVLNNDRWIALGWSPHGGGQLFERLVAEAFKRAGCDEVAGNIKWSFGDDVDHRLRDRVERAVHRRELDICARKGSRLLGISCKAGRYTELEAEAEVVAMTRSTLGLLGVPVLVTAHVEASKRDASIADARRVVRLGVCDLERRALRRHVNAALARRT